MEKCCLICGYDFEECNTAVPYGEDIMCPNCGSIMETEYEEDYDNMYWYVSKVKNDFTINNG